ncbi:hypothetical protein AB0D08_00500 [Kitasatospora sp. NPDC048540]|uniref:hypothetical protein n=1 Tax=Kitasatospora sp. NPDC048540 TaxID=3155634 RepID=UPI00340AB232
MVNWSHLNNETIEVFAYLGLVLFLLVGFIGQLREVVDAIKAFFGKPRKGRRDRNRKGRKDQDVGREDCEEQDVDREDRK